MARKYTESAIQREYIIWMAKVYPFVRVNYNKGEGKKTMLEATLDKKMGLRPGRPDLDLQQDINNLTYILELELKTMNGKLHESQKRYHAYFKPTHNKQLKVAQGLLHAQEITKEWVQECYRLANNVTCD